MNILEPDAYADLQNPDRVQLSQAISLKRIADALEEQNKIAKAVAQGNWNMDFGV